MIPVLNLKIDAERQQVEQLLRKLRLDPAEVALSSGDRGEQAAAVQKILADVASRGDEAVVESAKKFDDPDFTAAQMRVMPQEMGEAASRLPPNLIEALRRSIAQVREYQSHIMPKLPATLKRPGVELGLRFTPLDSAGLYFPGGKASYPSSLDRKSVV